MMRYIMLIVLLLFAFPAKADGEWGTSTYNPPIPQCHTVFVPGQGYTQVCQ